MPRVAGILKITPRGDAPAPSAEQVGAWVAAAPPAVVTVKMASVDVEGVLGILRGVRGVRALFLDCFHWEVPATLPDLLRGFDDLTVLALTGVRMYAEASRALAAWLEASPVASFDLGVHALTDVDHTAILRAAAARPRTNVRVVSLGLRDEDLLAMAEAPAIRSIRSLSLLYGSYGADAARRLAAAVDPFARLVVVPRGEMRRKAHQLVSGPVSRAAADAQRDARGLRSSKRLRAAAWT